MTKIVTATAALRLVDEGHLDLDAPASQHVPGLGTRRSTGPTVRQLLNHTAGLTNPLPLRWVHAADAAAPDPDAMLRHLLSRRRAFGHVYRASRRGTPTSVASRSVPSSPVPPAARTSSTSPKRCWHRPG